MKKQIVGAALLALNCFAAITACKKNENSNSNPIALQTIQNDPMLTIFSAVAARSGDASLFTNGYTYIVPEDNTFISQGISIATVPLLSQSACDSIIRYCSIPSIINFNGGNSEVVVNSSLSGATVFADSTSAGFYFNGVLSTDPPVAAGTSVIYKLSDVLILPAASVSVITSSDPDLSLFNEALAKTNLLSNFSSGSYTLFMPNNNAFLNAGYPDIASIDAADVNTLTQLLLYHSINNTYFPNDIFQQTGLTTVQGGSITVDTSSGSLQLKGNSDPGEPATLLSKGLLAGNVVAFKISQVLIP